jgi:hypothetical protein
MRKSLMTLMDYTTAPLKVSELQNEEVPHDPYGLLQPPSQIWVLPR